MSTGSSSGKDRHRARILVSGILQLPSFIPLSFKCSSDTSQASFLRNPDNGHSLNSVPMPQRNMKIHNSTTRAGRGSEDKDFRLSAFNFGAQSGEKDCPDEERTPRHEICALARHTPCGIRS
jgi:hypothetical protein